MPEVFLCRTGQLTATSRRELKRGGIVVVEVDDPAACQFIRAAATISHEDMLWAAMDALRRDFGSYSKGEKQREQFTLNLWSIVQAAHESSRQQLAEGGTS